MSSRESRKTRPEQQFFEDPAIDRLTGTVMALAMEVFVLKSQTRALEERLGEAGIVDLDDLKTSGGNPERLSEEAAAFSEHLLRPLRGIQDAIGPSD